jgi:hypothetical protein
MVGAGWGWSGPVTPVREKYLDQDRQVSTDSVMSTDMENKCLMVEN